MRTIELTEEEDSSIMVLGEEIEIHNLTYFEEALFGSIGVGCYRAYPKEIDY